LFTSADEVLNYIKSEGVEMVDVRFCDLPGVMQHFTVPVGSFTEDVFTDGLGFDGSSIRGFQQIHESTCCCCRTRPARSSTRSAPARR
jgi:glutamine synthetase